MTRFYFTSAVVATLALNNAHAIIQPSVTHEEEHVVLTVPFKSNEAAEQAVEQMDVLTQSPISEITDSVATYDLQLQPSEEEIFPFFASKPIIGEKFQDCNGIVWTVSDVPHYLGTKLHNFDVILMLTFRDEESQK